MSRRALGEMLADVGAGLPEIAQTGGVRVREVVVALPVEIAVRGSGAGLELLADMPRLRTRTTFDIQPSRLVVVWEPLP